MYRFIISRLWWLIVVSLLAAAGWLGWHIPSLKIEAGTDVLLDKDDPDLGYYNETRTDWGSDEYAIVCATHENWFSPEGVQALQEILADIMKAPHVRSTLSILDVPLLRLEPGKAPNLFALPNITSPGIDFDAAKRELLSHNVVLGNLLSADGSSVSFLVNLDTKAAGTEREAAETELGQRRKALVKGMREVAATWSAKLPEPVRLSGLPLINVNLVEHVTHDLKVFGVASFVFFILAFLVVYRRIRFVVMPIVTCVVPVAIIVGWMSWKGVKITLITSNLPVLLFVLLLPFTVYFIERYRERRALCPDETALDSTLWAGRAICIPCLFSCATTMAGFFALTTSGILPVRNFGLMMTIGIGLGFLVVLFFLPSLSRPLPGLTVKHAGTAAGPRGFVRILAGLARNRPGWVIGASVLLLAVSIAGALRISSENKFTSYFWPDSEVYQGLEYIDIQMGGTTSLEVILKSDTEKFFFTEAGLKAIAAVESYFDGVPETGNVRSVKVVNDELRKSLGSMSSEALLPMVQMMIPDLMTDVINKEGNTARVFVRMQETAPTLHRNRILTGLRQHLTDRKSALEGLEVKVTGVFLLYANMLDALIESQKQTFFIVLGAIFLMLLLLFFRTPFLAIIVIVPQILPAVVMLGIMGWAGIPLDLVTVMIAAIAMGVGIDAGIQYTMRYRAELEIDGDRAAAVSRSHATIGRAIWIATSVIVAGFCVLLLSRFFPSVWFGLFTAIAMLMSQFAALTLLPSLFLVTRYPKPPKAKIAAA